MVAYLDHAATTPMRPEALAAMMPFLTEHFGNPSGSHAIARRAKLALEEARDQVAAALGCHPSEVVFTGGGTEADNLAVAGVVRARGGRAVCSAIEHHAVLHTTTALAGTVVPVDRGGMIDLGALSGVLDSDVTVVSLMLVNNEVGTVQPLDEAIRVVRERSPNASVHTGAVQAFPWVDVADLARDADLVSVSAHKFGGPKGVGALVVRRGLRLDPLIRGGGQEADRRSGTHNVAGIVGMASAMTATVDERLQTVARVRELRDRLADGLKSAVPRAVETTSRNHRVAGSCHMRFPGVESEALLILLDDAGVCASAGSACASGATEPSHVLAAMGLPREDATSAVRFSLGVTTTDADIDIALKAVPDAVACLGDS